MPLPTPMRSFTRRHAAALAGLAALVLALAFFRLGRIGLLDPDEARYAQTTREMLQRGDWAVPYFNGEPRLKKPPLYHWENLATYAAFGVNEFAARLPSALAFLGLVALTVAFAQRERAWPFGLRAGAILATSPLTFVAGRMVLLDMTLSVMTTAALFAFWQADRGRLAPRTGAAVVGLMIGLAILAKGPVGLLVPGLVIGVFLLQQGEWRRLLRWREILLALAISLSLPLPWLALVIHRIGLRPFWSVVFRETVTRYAETGLEHPQPWWFYLAVIALAAFPWSAFFLPAYVTGIRRHLFPREPETDGAPRRLASFLWIWIAVTLAFFSLGRGKLATYILPLMPALALLLSLEWERWVPTTDPALRRRARIRWGVSIALFLPAIVLTWVVVKLDPTHAESFLEYWPPFLVLAVVMMGGTLALSAAHRRWAVVPVLATSLTAFYLYAAFIAGGELENARSLRTLVREAQLDREDVPRMMVYRNFHPSLVFYTNRRVERGDGKDDLEAFLDQPGDAVVVMDTDRLAALPSRLSRLLQTVATQDRQVVLRKTVTTAAAPG